MKMAKQIYSVEGIKGFYRGYFAMVIMGLNGTFTIAANDILKNQFNDFYDTYFGNFVLGGFSRVISSTILYPFNTMRTRVM